MTHALASGFVHGGQLAYVEQCEYPNGTRVVASYMAKLGPAGIVRQTVVQAWDQ